ncbi:MAG: zinc-ribbon domain-containing protein [Oscillospiraceae bacterium]
MTFCTSCGNKIDDDSTFCEKCGAKQELPSNPYLTMDTDTDENKDVDKDKDKDKDKDTDTYINFKSFGTQLPESKIKNTMKLDKYDEIGYDTTNYTSNVVTQTKTYAPLTKQTKLIILIIACVIIVIGGFFFITKQIFTPEKTISKFVESIRDKDFAGFLSVTVPAKKELVIDRETITPFFEICDNHSELLTQFKNTLKSDINELKSNIPADGDGFLRLIEKNYLFFTTYKVEMNGINITFHSSIPDATVELGEKSASIKEGNTNVIMKNIIPGVYKLKANAENPFDSDEFTYRIDELAILPYCNETVDLKFPYSTLVIQRPEHNIASLTINDKTYKGDILFENSKELTIFPLNIGDNVKVSFNVDKIKMTDCYKIKGDNDSFLPQLKLPQSSRIEVMELAANFIKSYYAAINVKDIEKLKTLNTSQNNFINNNINQFERDLENPESRIDYKFTITNIQGDLELVQNRNNRYNLYYTGKVFVAYDCHFDKYKSGSTAPNETKDEQGSLCFNVSFGCKENGKWVLDFVNTSYFGRDEKIIQPIALL